MDLRPLYLTLLLYALPIWSCFLQPVAQSTVQECVKDGAYSPQYPIWNCNVKSLTAGNTPLASGGCSELRFHYDMKTNLKPAQDYILRVQFYEVYLATSLDQARWARNYTFNDNDQYAICECQGDEIYKKPVCHQGFPATCSTDDPCASVDGPCKSFCFSHGESTPCVGNAWWCGAVRIELQPELYFIAFPGGDHLYARMGLDVVVDGTVVQGAPTTYLLDNTQFIALVNDIVQFNANISLNSFAIPTLGLAGLGAWVSRYREPSQVWMYDGVRGQSVLIPVTSPFWYTSPDLRTWYYWVEDFSAAITVEPRDCSKNDAWISRNIAYPQLGESMRVRYKISEDYVYWNSTQGPSAHAKFNLTGVRSLLATIESYATNVQFLETYATVKLISAEATYACMDGEALVWLYLNNTGDAGTFSVLIKDVNGTYNVGSLYAQKGVANMSVPFPFASLDEHTVCAHSLIDSCVKFTANCVSPFNPYGPQPHGNGAGFPGGKSLAWYWWLLIAIVVLGVVICVLMIVLRLVSRFMFGVKLL